jgi:hypothetical protein
MIEHSGGAGLLLETAEPFLVRAEERRKYLDRDLASEPRISCAIYLAHSARAEEPQNFVGSQALPDAEAHERGE